LRAGGFNRIFTGSGPLWRIERKAGQGVVKLASRLRRPLLVVGTGALFLLAAFGSHLAALQASRVEALWPSNALVLAILILAGRNRQDVIAIIGGEVAGSVLLHLLRADPVAITSLLTIGNVTDSLLTFLFLRRMGVGRALVDRVDTFFAFALACAAGTAMPTGHLTLPQIGLLVFAGGSFAWLAHMTGAFFSPRGPERAAVKTAAQAVADFVKDVGTPQRGQRPP